MKKKITRFILRFIGHLMLMLLISVIVTKLYYNMMSIYDLLLMQKEFLWISILTALVTSTIGQKL